MGLFGKLFGGGNPEQPPQPAPEQEPTTDENAEDQEPTREGVKHPEEVKEPAPLETDTSRKEEEEKE